MIRFILWFFVVYVIWKVISALTPSRRPQSRQKRNTPSQQSPPFRDIQDAEYEDITPKSPPSQE